jgi:hypothetical protein
LDKHMFKVKRDSKKLKTLQVVWKQLTRLTLKRVLLHN